MYFECDMKNFKHDIDMLKKENDLLSKEKLAHEEMLKKRM